MHFSAFLFKDFYIAEYPGIYFTGIYTDDGRFQMSESVGGLGIQYPYYTYSEKEADQNFLTGRWVIVTEFSVPSRDEDESGDNTQEQDREDLPF